MSDKNPLISKIPPPTELPSFIVQQKSSQETEAEASKFCPEIPADKNITSSPTKTAKKSQRADESDDNVKTEEQEDELPSMQDIAQALSPLTEGVKNSVLFSWVKSGVQKVCTQSVQKAKESIDMVVSTLDPQMGQLICE